MSDIFISYARADRPRAEALAKALEAQGWSVWWDWIIPTGKKFRRVIEEEINKARCVVVLWSATSIESDWVIEEASEGKERGFLVPVLIEKVRPPMGFRGTQAADLVGSGGGLAAPAFQRLRGDIATLIGVARPGEARISPRDGLRYVWIPPGEFWMGDNDGDADEKPQHRVRITRGFWLGETPVTVAAYKQFVNDRPQWRMPGSPRFKRDWSKEDHPVVNVTWDGAQAYCAWAGGTGGRLPTEAQWEYAARGGKAGLQYPWGNEITPENANYSDSKWKGTSPMRSYPPNMWGLYDMAGNVWEWVVDWYDKDNYATRPSHQPSDDPLGPDHGTGLRVLRGGSFANDPRFLRVANRNGNASGYGSLTFGFRCVLEAAS
jgi:formylglycine-generating enzyme required for sulfatase activity